MKSLSLALLAGCAIAAMPMSATANATAAETPPKWVGAPSAEGEKLTALFKTDEEDNLKRNPIEALFRGDMRYADRMGNFVSDAYYTGERNAAQTNLTKLKTINRAKLNPTEQIAYDVFLFNQRDELKENSKPNVALTAARPINHFFGIHTFYPNFASGQGAAPFKTVADYDNNLKRHKDFVAMIDTSIVQFKKGSKAGIVDTKMTIRNVIDQLNTQLAQKTEDSHYYGPIAKFPDGFSQADKTRLSAE